MISVKILYLINHAGNGGSEKYVRLMAQKLSGKHGIYFAYNEDGQLARDMQKLSRAVLRLEMKSPFDLRAAKKLAGFAEEHSIDVIHSQFPRENYIAAIASRFIKGKKPRLVYTDHMNTVDTAARRFLNRFMTAGLGAAIAVCEKGRELLAENGYPKDRIHLIYNGAARPKVGLAPSYREQAGAAFVFGTLSRLSHEKGMDILVEAVSLIADKADFTVLIGGDGSERDRLSALIEQKRLGGRIKLLGHITNGPELLASSDVYVNCSRSEALSFALTEALWFGLPLIVSDVGGNPDVVNKRTNCGLTVEAENPRELANAMLRLVNDAGLRRELSQNALKAAAEIFNEDVTAARTLAVYKAKL